MEALGRIIIDFPASLSDFAYNTFIHNFINILYVKYELHQFVDWSLVRKVRGLNGNFWDLLLTKTTPLEPGQGLLLKSHVTISEVLAGYLFLLLATIFFPCKAS